MRRLTFVGMATTAALLAAGAAAQAATINGTNGPDTLYGTRGADSIYTRAGYLCGLYTSPLADGYSIGASTITDAGVKPRSTAAV